MTQSPCSGQVLSSYVLAGLRGPTPSTSGSMRDGVPGPYVALVLSQLQVFCIPALSAFGVPELMDFTNTGPGHQGSVYK